MPKDAKQPKWEIVTENEPITKRLRVDGGWLYLVQTGWENTGHGFLENLVPVFTTAPVFVRDSDGHR